MRPIRRAAVLDSDVFEPSPYAGFELDAEGLVLFDSRGGVYWRGNATAAEVMAAVGRHLSVGQIVTELGTRYDVPPDRITTDVRNLLGELERHQVVRRVRLGRRVRP